MNKKNKITLTDKEAHLITFALQSAAKWEFSISYAYNHKGENSKSALSLERRYNKLRSKIIDKIWSRKK